MHRVAAEERNPALEALVRYMPEAAVDRAEKVVPGALPSVRKETKQPANALMKRLPKSLLKVAEAGKTVCRSAHCQ